MIPDTHIVPLGWGIRPVLFSAGGFSVSSYAFFVLVGVAAAVLLYYYNTRRRDVGGNALYIALAAAVGGIIGSKVPSWVANFGRILADPSRLDLILSGRTIVGGIIGGAIAVWVVKRRLHITQRLGNYLVPSLCIGIFFGRIGCFLAGCCYGIPTRLPWGVNFGDGVLRQPTQLYEALFVLGLFVYAQLTLEDHEPGELFIKFMLLYFGWRFIVEFARVNPVSAMGLTYYQIVSLAVIAAYMFRSVFRTALDTSRGSQ